MCANRNKRSATEESIIATTDTAGWGDAVCICHGAVTSSLLTLEAVLMAGRFYVPAGSISPSHSGCWAKTVFWEEGRPRNLQQEIISLKALHI